MDQWRICCVLRRIPLLPIICFVCYVMFRRLSRRQNCRATTCTTIVVGLCNYSLLQTTFSLFAFVRLLFYGNCAPNDINFSLLSLSWRSNRRRATERRRTHQFKLTMIIGFRASKSFTLTTSQALRECHETQFFFLLFFHLIFIFFLWSCCCFMEFSSPEANCNFYCTFLYSLDDGGVAGCWANFYYSILSLSSYSTVEMLLMLLLPLVL